MEHSISPPRETWIDFTRALAALLVVLAHIVLYPHLLGAGPRWIQTVYYALSRVAVPLFFLVSGYLLLPKQEDWGTFFRKRALKILVPFLIWSVIYMIFSGGEFANENLSWEAVGRGLLRILRGPRAAHLWFFYVLIGLYLFTPVLRVFVGKATQRDLAYFCGLWFLANPVFSLVQHFTPVRIGFQFEFVTGYIGYYVLGLWLGRLELTRLRLIGSGAVALAAFLFTVAAIYLGQQQKGYDQFFEDYLSINVVLMTSSAFLLLRKVQLNKRLSSLVQPISRAGFGIYLVHILILESFDGILSAHFPFMQATPSAVMMPLMTVFAFGVCFLIVFILQKIPLLKYTVP